MSKSKYLEFEATPNADGEFICNSYTVIEQSQSSEQSSTGQDTNYQQQNTEHNFFHQKNQQGNTVFEQSYKNNFTSANNEYVDKMRKEFEQMRQSMLNQMESFTYVKNIKR